MLLFHCKQVGAHYGQLEACVRLIELGAKWPRGKGAKAAGGDVVTMLANSRRVQQRNLKVCYVWHWKISYVQHCYIQLDTGLYV